MYNINNVTMEARKWKKIINKLYEISLNTAEPFGFFDKESTEQEWRCYDSLYDNLSKEDREIFRE